MIITLFTVIPSNIAFLPYSFEDPMLLIFLLGSLALMVGFCLLLIFKAEKVCEYLKLEKGFDSEEFKLSFLSEKTIVKLASILLGGYLVINDVPRFLQNTFNAIKFQSNNMSFDANDQFYWLIGLLRIFIGLFLVMNFTYVQKVLVKKTSPNSTLDQ